MFKPHFERRKRPGSRHATPRKTFSGGCIGPRITISSHPACRCVAMEHNGLWAAPTHGDARGQAIPHHPEKHSEWRPARARASNEQRSHPPIAC